jgi:hypothetical protein
MEKRNNGKMEIMKRNSGKKGIMESWKKRNNGIMEYGKIGILGKTCSISHHSIFPAFQPSIFPSISYL